MQSMNWGAWLGGLMSALATGALTAITAIAVLPACPTGWQLFIVAGVPTALQFFGYIKQSPPPFGYKLVKQSPNEIVESIAKPKEVKP